MPEEDVDESVLAMNFKHDVEDMLSSIKDIKGRKYSDLEGVSPEIGYFGNYGQKLEQLLCDMKSQLSLSLVFELLMSFGHAFYDLQEFNVSQKLLNEGLKIYVMLEKVSLEQELLHIQATYSCALGAVRQLSHRDPRVAFPSTLELLSAKLLALQSALQTAVAIALRPQVRDDKGIHTKCIGLVLNGTIHIMSVCAPLKTLGFDADILRYMKYTTLVFDSLVQLCTIQFCTWRTYIYISIASSYEALALQHPTKRESLWKSAISALDMGIKRVQQLRKEEELDLPLPEATDATLKAAEHDLHIARFIVLKFSKATGSPTLTVTVTKAELEAAFPDHLTYLKATLTCLKIRSPQQWCYFGHWIAPQTPVIALADHDNLLIETHKHTTQLSLNDHIDFIKACFRYHNWKVFEEAYNSVIEQVGGIDAADLKLFHAFYELLHDATSVDVLNLRIPQLETIVLLLREASCDQKLCELRHDSLVEMICVLWHFVVVPCLAYLNARLPEAPRNNPVENIVVNLLLAMHRVSHTLHLDDIIMRSIIALRLTKLLSDQGNLRVAIQVLRVSLDNITKARGSFVDIEIHPSTTIELLHQAACGMYILNISSDEVANSGKFQQEHLNRALACIQTDMFMLLYDLEFDLVTSRGESGRKLAKSIAELESRMITECNKNDFTRGIFYIQAARRRAKNGDDQERLLTEALNCFNAAAFNSSAAADSDQKQVESRTNLRPPAPRLASRGSTFISLEVLPLVSGKYNVDYYMIFGKATGAGTDVSLNNNFFPGTGCAIQATTRPLVKTVTGLLPNESYVFAVAAYDAQGNVIEGIGATSAPVITLNPLVLPFCYGLLAQAAHELNLTEIAISAATILYNEFVTEDHSTADRDGWRNSSIFNYALKLRRSNQAKPLGSIAEYPMQVVHVFLRAISILIGQQIGSPDMNGRILPEEYIVMEKQQGVLEMINKGMLALDVACITGRHEYIAQVGHQLYNLMVPLLHLPSTCGVLLQPLCMLLESLQMVPQAHWDDVLIATYSCASYELLKIGFEKSEYKAIKACLKLKSETLKHVNAPLLAPYHAHHQQAKCFRDAIFLASEWMTSLDLSTTTVITANDTEKNAKGKTPRDSESKQPEVFIEEALPGLSNYTKAWTELKTFFSHHKDFVKYGCLIAKLALVARDKIVETILPGLVWSFKLTLPPEAKNILQALRAGHLIQEPPTQEAPLSARTEVVATLIAIDPPKHFDVLERDILIWSGQVYYLRGLINYNEIFQGNHESKVNYMQGPEHDLSWLYLQETSLSQLYSTIEKPSHSAHSFTDLLQNMSIATQLFYHAKAWSNLLECVKCIWNATWAAWVSPLMYGEGAYSWEPLVVCLIRLLDMVEFIQRGKIYNDVDALCRSTDRIDTEASSTSTVSQCKGAENTLCIDFQWVTKVALYTIQVLCTVKEWKHLVIVGKRTHELTGGQSTLSEQILPWVVFAQSQRCEAQSDLVQTNQISLNSFIKAFEDSQAKKKKKKSRLVVTEVISEEEQAFLEERQRREDELKKLITFQGTLKEHHKQLSSWLDILNRSKNMCLHALNRAQRLVAKQYLAQENPKELEQSEKSEVLSAFKQCITLCRQKRSTLLLAQSLMELGDFVFANGDRLAAVKAWKDGIDAVFGNLDAVKQWRMLLPTLQINGDGLLCTLLCVHMLGKLAWTLHASDLHERLECALMGSAVFSKFFTSSLPHPNTNQPSTFASYNVAEMVLDLPSLPFKIVHPSSFMLITSTLMETLLLNKQFIQVMPLASGVEFIAKHYFQDSRYTIQAKRMKAEACIGSGYMTEATALFRDIIPSMKPLAFQALKRLGDPENETIYKCLQECSVEKLTSELYSTFVALIGNEGTSAQGIALKTVASHIVTQLQNYVNKPATPAATVVATETPTSARKTPREEIPLIVTDIDPLTPHDTTKLNCECDLIQCQLALNDGLIDSAKASITRCMQLYSTTEKHSIDEVHFDRLSCELNTLFWLQCRIASIKCSILQGHYDDAITAADIAEKEAANVKESFFLVEIQILEIQARILNGDRLTAFAKASTLLESASPPNVIPVYLSLFLSNYYHTEATSAISNEAHISALERSFNAVKNGMKTMDSLLEHQGWIGLQYSSQQEQLINLYHPHISLFVVLKSQLVARAIKLQRASPETITLPLLPIIDDGLRALTHICNPQATLKPLLLYFKGVALQNEISIDCLVEALTLWIKEGGHPRALMHSACMELVKIYGGEVHPEMPQTCIQAAYHYLQLACKLQDQLHVLWNTSQLNGTSASAVNTLPASIQQEILASAKTVAAANGSTTMPTIDQLGYMVLPYYISMSRESEVVFDPSLVQLLNRTQTLLHNYLAVNHPAYSKQCLTSLPPVPKEDPEIPGGLVCVQWMQTSLETVCMYYALGTATNPNDHRFAEKPILSRKSELNLQINRVLLNDVSLLRHKLQDKEVRVGSVQNQLDSILHRVFCLFQSVPLSTIVEKTYGIPATLENVVVLERLFNTACGVNTPHNQICYFLRDALAQTSTNG
ncbi:hypothetical protein THRCLA_01301 [Thraustotheca clavata]|uniref:Uncharacterized protein n=1 Tax=Thraustotheca clavata TaxID=74557 RepID=A0A1W0A8V9_9STRA|nr:hypothetical protein THRCLA_01301 [Thraustotheca clavata]